MQPYRLETSWDEHATGLAYLVTTFGKGFHGPTEVNKSLDHGWKKNPFPWGSAATVLLRVKKMQLV